MRLSLVLLGMILLVFSYSFFPPVDPPTLSTADRDHWVDYIVQRLDEKGISISEEEALDYVKQAHDLASQAFNRDKQDCLELRNRMLQIFVDTASADVVILYNPGGWGRSTIGGDGQWGPVVREMDALLEDQGYTTVLQSFVRTPEVTTFGVIEELQELLTCFPTKCEDQVKVVQFLTQNRPDIQVIVTGLSQGAAYTNEVSKLLESNDQVYGVAAGVPFFYSEVETDRTLVLENNGIESDALKEGDAPALVKTTIGTYFEWLWHGFDGGPLGAGAYYDPPGHDYHWEDPGVAPLITDFLDSHFGENNP